MKSVDYDVASPESIRKYAEILLDKSLGELLGDKSLKDYDTNNKGRLGSMVEECFFEYRPSGSRNHLPDFTEAGLELKVTGVLPSHKKGQAPYKAKERLVLTMIDYFKVVDEDWEGSYFLKKCALMLILFYLYQKDVPISQLKFVMRPLLFSFPEEDLEIIKKDWEFIRDKVIDGKAHELSEGDTYYLAACRKGSGGPNESLRQQPYSNEHAKSRAFSLKPSYVNVIINNHAKASGLIKTETDAEAGIEKITLDKFSGLYGLTVEQIAKKYNYPPGEKPSKSYLSDLTRRILGVKTKKVPEFEKAQITVKTIRLQKNGNPKEAISFPSFKFMEIIDQDWEDTVFYDRINQKFFFVIYQFDDSGELRFKKAMFWNMPYDDREKARTVWERTVQAIKDSDMTKLPRITDRLVAHVRPHGQNKLDSLPLPNGSLYTKQCFWLNQDYVAKQISDFQST